jgi:hypothetical protein
MNALSADRSRTGGLPGDGLWTTRGEPWQGPAGLWEGGALSELFNWRPSTSPSTCSRRNLGRSSRRRELGPSRIDITASELSQHEESSLTAHHRAITIGTALIAVAVVLLAGYAVTTIPPGDPLVALISVAGIAAAASLGLSGAFLAARLPGNPIGWALAGGGLLYAYAYSGPGAGAALYEAGFGAGVWLIWLGGLAWVPAIVCMTVLVPLLFPTGRLPWRRWRIVIQVALVAIALNTIQVALSPFPQGLPAGITNPLAVSGPAADAVGVLGAIASLSGIVCLPLVAASLVLRYRAAAGIERAQLRWFAAVAALIGPAFAIGIGLSGATTEPGATIANLAFLATFIGLALMPVAIGIAVLRYRLYDIDLIVRGTAVYVPLTAILAGLYAATVALFQRLFVAVTGTPSDSAVILSTLILATMFTPIRGWLQGIVDRRFGDTGDAEHVLEAFVRDNATASWALDPTRTMRAFLAVSVRAFGSMGGTAFVGSDGRARLAASIGTNGSALNVPVEAAGQRVGWIELADRRGARAYSESELALLHRAASELAALLLEPQLLAPEPLPRTD